MGVVVHLGGRADSDPLHARMTSEDIQAARLLADLEIAKARMDVDSVLQKVGDPLAVEIHAIRRALALLDLTLHTSLGSRR